MACCFMEKQPSLMAMQLKVNSKMENKKTELRKQLKTKKTSAKIRLNFSFEVAMHWILLFLAITFSSLHAREIVTTNRFADIEELTSQLDCNSLVLFDVDGTLIAPEDAILKPHRHYLFKRLIEGHPERDLFRDIHLQAPHSLVDTASISLIQQLQEKGIPTLAFTAAPSKASYPGELGDWRIHELLRFGFDFRSAFPDHPILHIPKAPDQIFPPLFKSGILFSSLHSKGDILIHFLQKVGFTPNRVIFIDDFIEYIHSVGDALDQMEIEFIGVHYTASQEVPSHLNLELARFQISYFLENEIWLDDKACQVLFEAG